MTSPSSATAVTREVGWLTTSTDSLPYLLKANSGPFEVIQAFWPGARLASQKPGIYVDMAPVADTRVSNQRIRSQYTFVLTCIWPVKTPTAPIAETEQQNFSDALELLRQRITGPVGDKTHGGAFLSVAENPRRIDIVPEDPKHTLPESKALLETVTYRADDFEVNG
jgi:hypothetical protein